MKSDTNKAELFYSWRESVRNWPVNGFRFAQQSTNYDIQWKGENATIKIIANCFGLLMKNHGYSKFKCVLTRARNFLANSDRHIRI